MASVAAMMATTIGSVQALNMRSRSVSTLRGTCTPAFSTRRFVQIRCMAEPESDATPPASTPTAGPTPVPTPAASTVTPISTPQPAVPPKSKVSTEFGDIMAFSGPAPETINGRLAMLGFVGALAVEAGTGTSFTNQIANGGLSWAILFAGLFTAASLIPMFQGVTAESKSKRFWSAQAEKVNGRLAMVGLVALAITEYVNGSPLV